MSLKNDRIIRTLRKQPVDCTPIWIMRQAGRYLPEYRAVRKKAGDFLTLCKTPELACEVTLQPLARFPLDAAILFSDILTIPDALGLGLHFVENEGPRFHKPIQSVDDVKNLANIEVAEALDYVYQAAKLVKQELVQKVPLIGFSGSPWTIACYMVENGPTKTFSQIKKWLYQQPQVLQSLLAKLSDLIVDYLYLQIEAGADVVMIFDSWGGVLSTRDYQLFSLEHMQRIIAALKQRMGDRDIPIILFTKGGGQWLPLIASSGCDAAGIDWTLDLKQARALSQDKIALQGNMDPSVLYGSPERIKEEVERILASYGTGAGHVFNLGHGIAQDVSPDNVAVLVDTVHELSKIYHK